MSLPPEVMYSMMTCPQVEPSRISYRAGPSRIEPPKSAERAAVLVLRASTKAPDDRTASSARSVLPP
jgi:hypothetical protein